jgi:hypothetical protein
MYPGVATPPGFALWTACGWLFIHLCPFSNIAWRLSLMTSLMAALACGFVALMVSRGGKALVQSLKVSKPLAVQDEVNARLICGVVAGLGFGYNGYFWYAAIRPDPDPLGLLLWAVTLCLLMRWFFAPDERRYLVAAAFVYGLTLTNNQILVAAAGLPFLIAMSDQKIGRDVFFGVGILGWFVVATNHFFGWFESGPQWRCIHYSTAGIATAMSLALALNTGRLLSEWKTVVRCALLFCAGLSLYLLSPLFSMTTPPMDWAYPRTVEGFGHLLSRGQFECIYFTDSFQHYLWQWWV